MNKDAFELLKNTEEDNQLDWLKSMLFIEYGRVVEVIDSSTVRVQQLVQRTASPKLYVVRLLNINANDLQETTVQPELNDQVLLLFLRSCNQSMFFSAKDREKEKAGTGTIVDPDPQSYNAFSGVGLLASSVRGRAYSSRHYGRDSNGPYISESVSAKLMSAFKSAVNIVFDVPLVDQANPPDDGPVSLNFGARSPLVISSERGVVAAFDEDVAVSSKTGLLIEVAEDEENDVLPATVSITDSGLIVDTADRPFSIATGDGNIDFDGAEIHLNGDGKRLVTWDELNTALQGLVTALGTHVHPTAAVGTPSPPSAPLSLDLSAAKTTTVKTGG